MNKVPMTVAGEAALREELERLKKVDRPRPLGLQTAEWVPLAGFQFGSRQQLAVKLVADYLKDGWGDNLGHPNATADVFKLQDILRGQRYLEKKYILIIN